MISKIAVFLPDWLGEVVIGTPVYRSLRERFGRRARLVGVGRRHHFSLFAGSDWFDELWPFRSIGSDERLSVSTLRRRLREEHFDLAVLMNDSLSAGWTSMLAGIPRRVGYSCWGRDWSLSDVIPRSREADGTLRDEPLIHRYLRLVAQVDSLAGPESRSSRSGVSSGSPIHSSKASRSLRSYMRLELNTTRDEEIEAEGILQRWGIRTDRRVIFLHSNRYFGSAHRWPEAYLAVLSQMIVDRLGHDVVIVNAPGDEERDARVVDATHRARVFSIPLRSFGVAKAILKYGRLVVATDSGLGRIAQAVGVPLIGLYGPTKPLRGANPSVREEAISLDIECQGCGGRDCPKGHTACMNDLFPERVFYQIERRFGDKRRSA